MSSRLFIHVVACVVRLSFRSLLEIRKHVNKCASLFEFFLKKTRYECKVTRSAKQTQKKANADCPLPVGWAHRSRGIHVQRAAVPGSPWPAASPPPFWLFANVSCEQLQSGPKEARKSWKKWFSNVKATTMLLECIPDRRDLLCWSDIDKNETVFATLHIRWLEGFSTDGLRLHAFQTLFLFYYPHTSGARGPKGTLLLDYDLWPWIPFCRWVSTMGSSIPGSHFSTRTANNNCKSHKHILLRRNQLYPSLMSS